jgi:ribose transport system substrate-binding protein
MHFIEVCMLLKKLIILSISMLLVPIVFGKTIALVQINQQAQFFTDMNRGAEDEASTLGHKLVIFNANNDPAAQNNAIETYIQ